MDLKTSPTGNTAKLNVDKHYPRKATQVNLKNIMPAPPLNTLHDKGQQISSKIIIHNTSAIAHDSVNNSTF